MTHIDVHNALELSAGAAHHDLVTRRTGLLVRTLIERQLAGLADGTVAFLDFSRIGVLDRSCADEFVAKLVLPLTSEHAARNGYVILHGVNDGHIEAIEQVLLAHGLALVVQCDDGEATLVGAVTDLERRLWTLVMETGGARPETVPDDVGLARDEAEALLASLERRRLVRRGADDRYCPLGEVA